MTAATIIHPGADAGATSLDDVVAAVDAAPLRRPFDAEAVDFCAELSRTLGRRTRDAPELQALAFWMRRSAVTRLADSFRAMENETTVLVPRGTVFHVPPANVDTVFVYSWLLATLTGNRNLVRLSTRATGQVDRLLDLVRDCLRDHPGIAASTAMVRYGHDRAGTDLLSSRCDLRVIWGGDGSVAAVRESPLPARATDLTFPDRTSFAVVDAATYDTATEAERAGAARDFYNDTFWFDQLGCSSPRAVIWVGDAGVAARCSREFYARLRGEIDRAGYGVDPAAAIAKVGFTARTAIDHDVTALDTHGSSLAVLSVPQLPALDADFAGGGTLFHHVVGDLGELAGYVDRKVQTIAQFGFGPAALREFAVTLNGRGVDRIVPFGQALTFDRVWDGTDLLQAFSRRVALGTASWSS